jgi:hypothetical protein
MKIILVDFDGVLHSYTSGWQGADVVADPPVPGAIEWLTRLAEDDDNLDEHGSRFEVHIYSSRSRQPGGIEAMQTWLQDSGLPWGAYKRLYFPTERPAAFLTIDDRCICFDGTFPSLDEIDSFVPWNRRDV